MAGKARLRGLRCRGRRRRQLRNRSLLRRLPGRRLSRRWLHRPEVSIRVPAEVLVALPERARRWLRFNPVFESKAEASRLEESYRAFAY